MHRHDDTKSESKEAAYDGGLGIRHLQVAVMSMGLFLAYSLWMNLSVAIVAMIDKSNTTTTSSTTFDWDETIQGYVLSSFFWGYTLTQIPAGILSSRFGGHWFLCASILISSALNIALPQCAYYGGWPLVCASRTILGLVQGFVFPSVYTLMGLWIPPAERSLLASVTISAQLLGGVVSTPATGFLIAAYGWPFAFYALGTAGAVVGVLMTFLGADCPSKHRMISDSEKSYIQTSLGGANEQREVPWKNIFKSVPYWSAVFTMALYGTVLVTFLTKIPTYLGTVLNFSIEENSLVTALSFLVSWLLSFVFSWICNALISRGVITITTARMLFNSIAHFGTAVFIVLLGHAEGRVLPVVFLTCAVGILSGVFVGVQSTFVDLAPNFSGAIYSISNCFCNLCGMVAPTAIGFIVTETGSVYQWRIVFYLCAILLVGSNIIFMIWGTSETQYWNWPDKYTSQYEYEKSKKEQGQNVQPEGEPVRRYSLHGARLMK